MKRCVRRYLSLRDLTITSQILYTWLAKPCKNHNYTNCKKKIQEGVGYKRSPSGTSFSNEHRFTRPIHVNFEIDLFTIGDSSNNFTYPHYPSYHILSATRCSPASNTLIFDTASEKLQIRHMSRNSQWSWRFPTFSRSRRSPTFLAPRAVNCSKEISMGLWGDIWRCLLPGIELRELLLILWDQAWTMRRRIQLGLRARRWSIEDSIRVRLVVMRLAPFLQGRGLGLSRDGVEASDWRTGKLVPVKRIGQETSCAKQAGRQYFGPHSYTENCHIGQNTIALLLAGSDYYFRCWNSVMLAKSLLASCSSGRWWTGFW